MLEVIDARRPDVAVVDCMLGSASLPRSRLEAVDVALLVHVLYQPWAERWGGEIIAVNGTREALGLPPFAASSPLDLIAAARATLVLLPAELDSPVEALPAGVSYSSGRSSTTSRSPRRSGPWAPDGAPGGLPLVVVSMSTTYQHQEAALALALGALAGLPVRVLVTLGHHVRPDAVDLPANAERAVGPAPARVPVGGARSDARRARHGAGGARLRCAAALPTPRPRAAVERGARAEARRGAILSSTAAEGGIREAAEQLLAGASFRDAAQRLAKAIAGYGDGARAVAALEALLP